MNPSQHVIATDGDGMIARRRTAVIFVSSETQHQAEVLIQRFLAASSDVAAMASVVAAAQDVPPGVPGPDVAILRWTAESGHLLVQGDVRVSTDDPTLPFMNGAGLAGWIERSLFTLPVTVTAGSGAPGAAVSPGAASTGGGFTATVAADSTGVHDAVVAPTVSRQQTFQPASSPAAATPAPAMPVAPPPTLAADTGSLIPPPPPSVQDAGYAALWDDPRRGGVTASPSGSAAPHFRSTFSHQPGNGTVPQTGPLMGRECMNQHPNPPEAASCRECGATLNPAAGELIEFPATAIGALVMDDGRSIPLSRSVLVGRKPNADSRSRWTNFTLVVIDDTKVSRNHLEVLVSGWDVQVVDCGSRNGTSLQFPGQPDRESLTPGVPVFIPVGATVRFGGRSLTFAGAGAAGGTA